MIDTLRDLVAEALFASYLQASETPVLETVRTAATDTILRLGSEGVVAAVAQEYGDHPEVASARMRWVRELLDVAYPMDSFVA
jgi:uncharacterized protein YfaQ (DUF2300 family)